MHRKFNGINKKILEWLISGTASRCWMTSLLLLRRHIGNSFMRRAALVYLGLPGKWGLVRLPAAGDAPC